MEENKLDITVVMPALNEEKNISLGLKNTLSALDESGISGEVIVINDGSKDKTEEMTEGFMQSDKRVKLINHGKPQGIGVLFGTGWITRVAG